MKLRPNLSESYNTELVHHIERNENSGAYLSLNQQMNIHSILTSLLTSVSWWAVVCVSLLHLPTDHSQSRVSGRPRVHQAVVWRPAGVRILLPLIERPAALPCAFSFYYSVTHFETPALPSFLPHLFFPQIQTFHRKPILILSPELYHFFTLKVVSKPRGEYTIPSFQFKPVHDFLL